MIYHNRKKSDDNSIISNDSSTFKSVWSRLSHVFKSSSSDNNRRLSISSSESDSSVQSRSTLERSFTTRKYPRAANLKKKVTLMDDDQHNMVIPPFSPTYCRPNEFAYSNFYVKLPNGKWMIRYRSGNRDILGTDEFEGYMIWTVPPPPFYRFSTL